MSYGIPNGWEGEACKRCCRANPIGFNLSDEIWNRISQGRWNVLCLLCVNELAALQGIDWTAGLRPGELYPVSTAMWIAA